MMLRIAVLLATLSSPAFAYDPCVALKAAKDSSPAAMVAYRNCQNATAARAVPLVKVPEIRRPKPFSK